MKYTERIKRTVYNVAGKIVGGLSQAQGDYSTIDKSVTPGMPELIREAAAEGIVMLKNEAVLPFSIGDTVAVFGRTQRDSFFVGYGSGGDVNAPYKINYIDGLKKCDSLKVNDGLAAVYESWCSEHPADEGVWGKWPRYFPEMPVDDELVNEAVKSSNAAVVIIGRSSGEDRENALEKGSYYLTDEELALLVAVTKRFDRVAVVLNIGSIIDMSWLERFGSKIGAVLIAWQGGMEAGNALADVLSGEVTPSGKLTDTVARDWADYPSSDNFGARQFNNYAEDVFVGYRWFSTFAPDKVVYPFGFGLSYAEFETKFVSFTDNSDKLVLKAEVTNTSDYYSGKQVVQLYCQKAQGAIVKPERSLVAFAKTEVLSPQETQEIELIFPLRELASYDEEKSAYVLEKGNYGLLLGDNVRDAVMVYTFEQPETVILEQLTEVSAAKQPFGRVAGVTELNGKLSPVYAPVPVTRTNLKEIILASLPQKIRQSGDAGYKLRDVRDGTISLESFVAQLSLDELEAISRGDYKMNSALGASGNAGAMGGVLPSLREKGIRAVITTDGPSGIRLHTCCSLLPIGTLLACTWSEKTVQKLYTALGQEMRAKGSDVLLAPGMNIHRNPLCGRNFEYYSEDPVVSGKIAAAAVRGIQSVGLSACPKHFACNNQETNRNYNDSRLSERALREIYLHGFEICVKESFPKCLMTSYNKINGVWGHYNYELCTTVLRGEWGYKGCVTTDWWMRSSKSPEFPNLRDNAYRVRSQVDVLMPGAGRVNNGKPDGTLLKTYGRTNGITIGEMQRTAMNVIRLELNLPDINVKND